MTDASRRAVLLGARIRLVCSLLAPCAAGASVISVRHRIYEQDHLANVLMLRIKENRTGCLSVTAGPVQYPAYMSR